MNRRLLLAIAAEAARGPAPITSSDSDVTAWIAAVQAAGGSISQTMANTMTTMVVGMKLDGSWVTLVRLWIRAGENATQATIDFVARASGTIAGHAPTFTAALGYTGNGTSQYVDTGYNASTGTQNSAFAGIYVQAGEPSGAGFHAYLGSTGVGGAIDGPLIGRTVANIGWGINQLGNSAATFAFASQVGFWGTERTLSNAEQLYKDSTTTVATSANVSGTVGNRNVYELAINQNGTAGAFSSAVISASAYGTSGAMAAGIAARIKTALNTISPTNFP